MMEILKYSADVGRLFVPSEAGEHTQCVYSSVVFLSDATVCRVNSSL